MQLTKEEYKQAKNCLKRYKYNCIMITNIRADIISIKGNNLEGVPKSSYNISDNVLNTVIQLQENKELQTALKEYKAIVQALQLVDKDSKYIFEQLYIKNNCKWDIINSGISERTYFRRKRELISAVSKELKKLA